MKNNEKGPFDHINGLTPIDPSLFLDFKRTMTDEIIPQIIRIVEERRLGAAKSRHWQLKY